jgi:VanZ family protein
MAAIFFISGQSTLPGSEYVWDKVLHAGAYAVFGLFCLRATHGGIRRLRGGPTAWALALGLAYAAFDEWHQSWVPGRMPSLGDWIADLVGLGIACLGVALWTRTRRSRA